jgi:hypothetical protein
MQGRKKCTATRIGLGTVVLWMACAPAAAQSGPVSEVAQSMVGQFGQRQTRA